MIESLPQADKQSPHSVQVGAGFLFFILFQMEKLKDRWGITSNIQIVLIFIVFAINGSFAAWVAEPVMSLLGIYKTSISVYIYWPIRIIIIFPIYQLTLPLVGFLFGQFKFFWSFEEKFLSRIGLGFLFKKEK